MNLHTETTHPFITIWNIDPKFDYFEVRPGKIKRPYFDDTHNAHGYHCHALSTMALNGWEIVLPQDVEIIWNGISDSSGEHVQVISGELLPDGRKLVQTDTANGTISFNLNAIFETDKDHHLLLSGPPNYFVDGASAMSAIIQSDWYHHSGIQFCWKLTKVNEVIRFPKGMPFVFLMNYPKNLLESTEFKVAKASDEMLQRKDAYTEERGKFYDEAGPWKWSGMYKHGVNGMGPDAEKYIDSIFRPQPKCPVVEK